MKVNDVKISVMVRNETQKIFTTKGIFGKYIQSFRGKGE
jgi:hypothetical protein